MAERWSPLDLHLAHLESLAERTDGWVTASEDVWDHVLLRGDPSPADLEACGQIARVTIPAQHDRVERSPRARAMRLGPDEWLLCVDPGSGAIAAEMIARQTSLVTVDQSAARITITLRGQGAPDIISGACAVDISERELGPGKCAQTLFARIPVIIEPIEPMPAYRVICRPSVARYLSDWILDAADPA